MIQGPFDLDFVQILRSGKFRCYYLSGQTPSSIASTLPISLTKAVNSQLWSDPSPKLGIHISTSARNRNRSHRATLYVGDHVQEEQVKVFLHVVGSAVLRS